MIYKVLTKNVPTNKANTTFFMLAFKSTEIVKNVLFLVTSEMTKQGRLR